MQGGSAGGVALTAYVVISMLENSNNAHVSQFMFILHFTPRFWAYHGICYNNLIWWFFFKTTKNIKVSYYNL